LGVFYEPVAAAAVVAGSPDHATFATEGLTVLRGELETLGQDIVRGQAFDKLSRAETRAQPDTRAKQLVSLVDLLAESIHVDREAQVDNTIASHRHATSRSQVTDDLWANWRLSAL
jgi:hypothetical protein